MVTLSQSKYMEEVLSPKQCWSELFELFDYSNSKDRIVVFGIRIRTTRMGKASKVFTQKSPE